MHFDSNMIAGRRHLGAWETNNLPDSPREDQIRNNEAIFNLNITAPSRRRNLTQIPTRSQRQTSDDQPPPTHQYPNNFNVAMPPHPAARTLHHCVVAIISEIASL